MQQQQRIYRFLLDCCRETLHDIPADRLTGAEYPILPEPSLSSDTATGFASLATMAAEAPYRVPASLDLSRLESLLAAKVSAAEDHLWALREDPGYFADSLLDLKEHRVEIMRDTMGEVHPVFRLHQDAILWNRVIGTVMTDAYVPIEIWTDLHQQVRQLQALQRKYAAVVSPDKDLPQDPLEVLKRCTTASPPLRPYHVRVPSESDTSTKLLVMHKPGLKFDKIQSQFFWLIRTLWDNTEQLFLAGLTNVVDELERLMQTEPKAKEMVSSYIAGVLADLSVITEAIRQLEIYQPWAQTFEHYMAEKEEQIKNEYAATTKQWGHLIGIADGSNATKIAKLGDPSDRKFHYPVEKRRTKENVEAMQAAERNLDAFWAAVDQNLQARVGKDLDGTAVRRVLAQPRSMARTGDWVDPAPVVGQGTRADGQVEVVTKPLSELYFDLERRTEATVGSGRSAGGGGKGAAGKTKTRRAVTEPTDQAARGQEEAPPSALPDRQPTFTVDARALKVFRTLFHTPSVSATPGEVVWTDFLHAMASAGFLIEKLYGSVWAFQPTRLDVERGIQFHEPHPAPKMGYRVARRVGRRLERAYGWWGGMFVLREKGEGKEGETEGAR
ncbi:hypothetical protein LTR36_005979 [Oleoguttula mirabilis]|uniref:Uncharacterized protein n=1 Tax=Oleoguttula mirabilis TaxID=1507867 RepID=A0AAV9JCV6_9PEZI|nr:hypothetical protein LTR36_005979 [Oleoguttula mirabilis]